MDQETSDIIIPIATGRAAAIAEAIEPALQDIGFDIVQLQYSQGTARRSTVAVFLEKRGGSSVTLDECATASRTISSLLDVEDLISESYMLEVSSPGIDRPLVRRRDFENAIGARVKIHLDEPIDGQARFTGTLAEVGDGNLTLTADGKSVQLDFARIQKAKMVLTDELLKAPQKPQDRKVKQTG